MEVIQAAVGILAASAQLFYQMSPYLLFGFAIAGLMHVFISFDWIARHLGRSSVTSVLKSVVLGIPLPLCSCGVIPAAVLLNKKGASRGAVIGFLIATPITGVDSILATYSLLGLFFTVCRIVASALTAIVAGLLANLFLTAEKQPLALAEPPAELCEVCGKPPCCQEAVVGGHSHGKTVELFHYAFVELLGDIWRWLLLGLLIGGAITYLVPDVLIERYLGSPLLSMLIMMVVGIPMYVCATGSLPIAAALMMKGMSPGAALVFLLAGPATNAVTITVVAKELGKGAAFIYVITIAVMSIACGFALNWLWFTGAPEMAGMRHAGAMLPREVEVGSAVVLAALIIFTALKDAWMKRRTVEHHH